MFCPSAFFARNDGTIGDSPIDCFGRFHDTMPHYNPNDVDRLTPMEVLSVSKLTLAEFDAMPMPPVSNQHPKQQLPLALAPVTEQSLIVRRASQNSDDPLHDPRYCSRSSQPVLTPSPQAQTCFKYDVGSNVFVCGLTSCITDADLMKLFSPFGPIESAKVMLDIHTGKSRGIAFVKFHAVADAQHAIAAMNGHQLNGRILSVRLADAKASFNPVEPSTKVFVRNLPTQITADRLREYFARFGAVADLKVRSDTVATPNADSAAAGSKRHIAFVSFYDAKVAARAVSATHTARPFPECGDVPLLAKFAVPSRHTEAPPAHAPAAKSPMSATSNNSVNVCATAAPMTMRATPLTQYATPIPHMPSPMTLPLCMPSYNPAPMTLPTYAAAPAWCVAPPQQPPTAWGYQQQQIVHLVVVSPASCGAPMGTTFCHMNNNNSAPIVLGGMVPSW